MRFLIALAATALLTAPLSAQTPEVDAPIRPVQLITVAPDTNGVIRQFFGQIVARQTVDLAFQVAGQIVEFPAIEGEEIANGALIAELDMEPFELQLDQARLQLDQAERTLERLNQLSGTAASQVSIDDAQTAVSLAEIAVRNAEYSLEHATLSAPFDGLIAARNVANFTTVAAGTAVVRVHDMSELRIEIDVPEILFQRAGADPNVTLSARFPTSDTLHPLEIREFDAQASAVGQTFRLTLGLPRPEGLTVLPGSSVTVLAELNLEDTALIIPTSAIHIANDGSLHTMVFVPGDGDIGTIEQRALELAATREGAFRVLSGLEAGEEIVLTGVNALEDGLTVRRFTGFAN